MRADANPSNPELRTNQAKAAPRWNDFQYQGGTNSELYQSPAGWISPNTQFSVGDGSKVIINDTDHSYYWTRMKTDGPAAQ